MITFLFSIRAQGWVSLPLCCPAAARFLEAVGLSLEIIIIVEYFLNYRHQVLVGGGEFGVVGQ